MLDLDPAMLKAYKRIIDDGYALPYGEAMALEARVASAYNAAVSPEAVEARRRAVVDRGRRQSS
jgi:enoyl-CoA hydratase